MNGNKWGGKPAQNKTRKNLQLLVKNYSLGGLNALNGRSLNDFFSHSSILWEGAKDKVSHARQLHESDMNTLGSQILYSLDYLSIRLETIHNLCVLSALVQFDLLMSGHASSKMLVIKYKKLLK